MKQIRKLLFILLAPSLIYSCGEAGIGFDVTADYPVTAPIDIFIPGNTAFPNQDVDPDATVLNYNLGDVDAFSDALDDLESNGFGQDALVLNGLAFEITGIDSDENLPLDELTIIITLSNGTISIPLAENMLANKAKTEIVLTGSDQSSLISQLLATKSLNSEVIVDVGTITTSPDDRVIDFDFKLYFDVLLKVRDL